MILLAALLFGFGDVQAGTITLRGPLESVVFETSPQHRTRVYVSMVAGEQRTMVVPFTVSALSRAITPRLVSATPADGQASFVNWVESDEDWATLPPALRSRTRPPVLSRPREMSVVPFFILVATGVLVLGIRRKPVASFVVGCIGAGAVLFSFTVIVRFPVIIPVARVLDGDRDGNWVEVNGGYGWLDGELDGLLQVEVLPLDAPMEWSVGSSAGFRLESLNRPVYSVSNLDPGHREFRPDLNAWGSLAEVWTKDEGGRWRAHGGWELGADLPPEQPDGDLPPSWLATGLPQGRSVLVARIHDGEAFIGSSRGGYEIGPTWIRLTGF